MLDLINCSTTGHTLIMKIPPMQSRRIVRDRHTSIIRRCLFESRPIRTRNYGNTAAIETHKTWWHVELMVKLLMIAMDENWRFPSLISAA